MSIAARLDRLPLGRFHWNLLTVVGIAWFFDSFNVTMVSLVLPVIIAEWKLTSPEAGLVGSAQIIGMLVGSVGVGFLSDRLGRKVTIELNLLTFGLAAGLSAIINNYAAFTILRFVAGLGLGGLPPVMFTLMSEFAPSRRRGALTSFVDSFWSLGLVVSALVAYLVIPTMGWQAALPVGALPVLYSVVLRVALPESPRFLQERGRHAEANEMVRRIEAGYSRDLPPWQHDGAASPEPTAGVRFGELWSKSLRRRTICIWGVSFALVFAYYGIFTWLPALMVAAGYPMSQAFLLMVMLGISQFPGKALAAYLTDHVGRKWVIVTFCILFAIAAYFLGLAVDANAILFWGCLLSFINAVIWGPVLTYTVELYPTRARATGAGATAAFSRLGGILGPIMVGFLLVVFAGDRATIFAVFAAAMIVGAMFVAVLGEETRGKTLEQIAR